MIYMYELTLGILVSSADSLCKQFGPRSGPTKCQVRSGSKQFDSLMVFLKEFFQKIDFEKNQQTTKSIQNYLVLSQFRHTSFLYNCLYIRFSYESYIILICKPEYMIFICAVSYEFYII